MKLEHPHFKRAKHIELLRKEVNLLNNFKLSLKKIKWEKSPENPFNQKTIGYNEKK